MSRLHSAVVGIPHTLPLRSHVEATNVDPRHPQHHRGLTGEDETQEGFLSWLVRLLSEWRLGKVNIRGQISLHNQQHDKV